MVFGIGPHKTSLQNLTLRTYLDSLFPKMAFSRAQRIENNYLEGLTGLFQHQKLIMWLTIRLNGAKMISLEMTSMLKLVPRATGLTGTSGLK